MVCVKYTDTKESVYWLMLNKQTRNNFRKHWFVFYKQGLRSKQHFEKFYAFSLSSSAPIFLWFDYCEDLQSILDIAETLDKSEFGSELSDFSILFKFDQNKDESFITENKLQRIEMIFPVSTGQRLILKPFNHDFITFDLVLLLDKK